MSIVETSAGKVLGSTQHGLQIFRGIPYARAGRLAPPEPPEPWSHTRAADTYGPEAPQLASPLPFDREERPQAEDCLSLNVWTPAADAGARPVMVWIHGGGFQTGGGGRALYDGSALARAGDLVVISLNYRLGVLGLLAHPDLAGDAPGAFANWCLRDQVAALEWVRANVPAFGGDPSRVTIFGESAGGASVALLAQSPRARGLFRRAIVQSSSPLAIPLGQGLEAGARLCQELGLASIPAVRDAPLERLLEAQPRWAEVAARGRTAPRPVIGDDLLPESLEAALDAGATDGVELIVGSNRDEWKLFGFLDPKKGSLGAGELRSRLARELEPGAAEHVIDVYTRARRERGEACDPWEIFCAVQTDRLVRVPALRMLEQHVARGGSGRAYQFDWSSPNAELGACHGLELPFCFGTLPSAPGMKGFAGSGAQAERLMTEMIGAWTALAQGRSPTEWPLFDAARTTRVFDAESRIVRAPREPERAVWDELEPYPK